MCIRRNLTRTETLLRTKGQSLFLSVSSSHWMYPTLSASMLSHLMTTLGYRWRPLVSLQPISWRISALVALLFSSTWWARIRRCATGSTTTRMILPRSNEGTSANIKCCSGCHLCRPFSVGWVWILHAQCVGIIQ